MTAIVRSVRGGRTYYYLAHTYRWRGKVATTRRYLGEAVPRNVTELKLEVERDAWARTWFLEFDKIRKGYQSRLRTLPPEVADRERHEFVLDFTYDTNRIEGSTLSAEDTSEVIDRGVSPASKPLSDVLEAQAHARLAHDLLAHPVAFGLPELLRWHSTLFQATKPGIAGKIRDYEVRIRGSQHVPPTGIEVRPMLKEALRWVRRNATVVHPVERAATFHFRFELIHPFEDGNGRIGRLAMNVLLAEAGYPPLNVQYTKRRGYYHALERASSLSDPGPFTAWFFRRYLAMNRRFAGTS